MQPRLYIDEDAMDDDLVQALSPRGADVQTALEAALVGRSDEEQLAHAAGAGRVLYTFNVGHFTQLHGEYMSAGRAHAGIVFGDRQRFGVGEQMRRSSDSSSDRSRSSSVQKTGMGWSPSPQ